MTWIRNVMTIVNTTPSATVCPSESNGFFIASLFSQVFPNGGAIISAGLTDGNRLRATRNAPARSGDALLLAVLSLPRACFPPVAQSSRKARAIAAPAMPPDPAPSAVARLVRQHDRDRFLTALFAPAERRQDLFALYAFNYEIARVREVVSETLLGRIRLQWWRDALDEIYGARAVRRHEVVEPLAAAIRGRGLSRAHFDRLIDAREQDLADERLPSLAALEAYAEATSSRLLFLALEVLGESGATALAAARAAGIAYALAGLLRAIPFHARAKRLYLPQDRVAAAGIAVDRELFELRSSLALRRVVAEVAALAQRHLDESGATRSVVARRALPALLPAVLARADLARLARSGFDPFDPRLARPDPLRSWRLTLAMLRRRPS
jgi:NADH dehydrogenase [ubiquinone] 1 alpha subcomplex assembly factor 6